MTRAAPAKTARAEGSRPSRRRARSPMSRSSGATRTSHRMFGAAGTGVQERRSRRQGRRGHALSAGAGRCGSMRPDAMRDRRAAARTITQRRYGLSLDWFTFRDAAHCDARGRFQEVPCRTLTVNGVSIDDTFAEAFGMRATAIVITAPNRKWARQAAITMTGFATSVIGCGCEAAIDVELPPRRDAGRASRLPGDDLCRSARDELQKQLAEPRRPMRADLARQRLFCRRCRTVQAAQARRRAALFRRRLADLEETRRPAFLARSGHGRRVPLRGDDRA